MRRTKDRIGEKVGRLLIIGVEKSKKRKGYDFVCKCDCGNVKTIRSDCVGVVTSCGCLKKEQDKINLSQATHNKSKSRLYKIFQGMKRRVLDIKNPKYYRYGGRGIKIFQPWLDDFEEFYNWAINNGYQDGLSVERVDNDGNYEPKNCKWISFSEQAKNRKNTKWVIFKDKKMCLFDFSKYTKVKYNTLAYRYDKIKTINILDYKLIVKESELQDNTEVTD